LQASRLEPIQLKPLGAVSVGFSYTLKYQTTAEVAGIDKHNSFHLCCIHYLLQILLEKAEDKHSSLFSSNVSDDEKDIKV
jgi:hypothetical protein